MKPISTTIIIMAAFLASALFLFAAAPWLAPDPPAEAGLARIEGVIEQVEDTPHPKEHAGAFSAAILIRNAGGATHWLHTIEADVANEARPALEGRRIDALYAGERIFAMAVDGAPLFPTPTRAPSSSVTNGPFAPPRGRASSSVPSCSSMSRRRRPAPALPLILPIPRLRFHLD